MKRSHINIYSTNSHQADELPKVKGKVGQDVDIHEVERLRRDLRRSQRLEESWRRALDASNQGAWSLDVADDEFHYCDGWRRMRGLEANELLDMSLQSWIANVHPDDHTRVIAAIEAQNSGTTTFTILQYREQHRLGHWMWIESRSSVLAWDEEGRPVRVVGTDADITERKATEQALEDMSRKLSLAMDVAGIGLFEADLETGEVRRDKRLLELYGLDDPAYELDVDGVLQRNHLHPDDRDACAARIAQGTASGKPFQNEFRIITAVGEIRHIRSKSVPYTDNEGRRKLLGINWDITSDMNVQEALRSSAASAEARSEALEQARATIKLLAVQDELTGLLNRRGLNEQFLAWDKEPQLYNTVLHLDLDHFKQINDELGHLAGDLVLKCAAERIQSQLRDDDLVARWGGDEFVILTGPHTDLAYAKRLAEAIIRTIAEPLEVFNQTRFIGVSIGIAETSHSAKPDQLLLAADLALYKAKASGKGQFAFAADVGATASS